MPSTISFSDECGPGTFHSLGVLPKRARDISPPPATVCSSLSSGSSSSSSTPRRPLLTRGVSAPIIRSSGKPLKSSLKSSSFPPISKASQAPSTLHRSRSVPPTSKNVHFPEEEALAIIRVYNCSARPAAVSNPANGNGDETETDGEDTPPIRFPFPSLSYDYEIDPTRSSPVPCKPLHSTHLFLESLNLSSPSSTSTTSKPLLSGSILVRNLAFEKHVAVRFTLDDWQTVSEVGANYVNSLSLLPSQFSSCITEDSTSQRGRGWDRFTFTIRLEDYAHSLSTRTLWLAARYRTDSTYPEPGSSQDGPGGEWWDNNGGRNYCAGFRPAVAVPRSSRSMPRPCTVPASISSPRTQLQPPTTCLEHALGLMVPSVSDNKENRRLTPLRTKKLSVCNYAAPTIRAKPIPSPFAGSTQTSLPSLSITALPTSAAVWSPSDEDSASPASSTLSTPSTSPTTIPHVIIGGQPATSTYSEEDDYAIKLSRPGHIADWEWSTPSKLWVEEPSCQRVDVVPASEPPERHHDTSSPPGIKALHGSNSLYDALVSRCCFAKGPFPSHHAYDGGGIMA